MSMARFITIRVSGNQPPKVDITGFTPFEAQSILQLAAETVDGLIPTVRIVSDGCEMSEPEIEPVDDPE